MPVAVQNFEKRREMYANAEPPTKTYDKQWLYKDHIQDTG